MSEIVNLSWLAPAPDDFRAQCNSLTLDDDNSLKRAAWLAGHKLSSGQLGSLASRLETVGAQDGEGLLIPFTLAVLGNSNLELIVDAIETTGLRYGLRIQIVTVGYGQTVSALMDPNAEIYTARPDAVLLAQDIHSLPRTGCFRDEAEMADDLGVALGQIELIHSRLREHSGATLIVQTLPHPCTPLFGSLDARVPGTLRSLVDQFNNGLHSLPKDVLLLDVGGLASRVGLDDWHDPVYWHHAKLPFRQRYVPLYADHVCRLLAASKGKSRKCLVLDLDNTLWGGVIGDDGLDGIVLGQGDAAGEAFLDVQRTALDLKKRGVILAVCSKNEEDIARSVFQKHPEMLLKESDIACFVANWSDKASNLVNIAHTLNIGVDSLVLLDDNPVERHQVRLALPMVAVPELPAEPSYYARTLLAAGYFEAISYTFEDSQRAQQYGANTLRSEHMKQCSDTRQYLSSLDMQLHVSHFDEANRPRIVQLINKTNQFNLTTRRYTETEIIEVEENPRVYTLYARLTDIFGDNGIISTVICRTEGIDWRIDTWLMSCRVLGREVETAILSEIVRQARDRGVARIYGEYIPTQKNRAVSGLFERLGFSPVRIADSHSEWVLELETFALECPPPINIVFTAQCTGEGDA